jgi:hypothetical protein
MSGNRHRASVRRVVSCTLALAGVPGFLYCTFEHLCMDGHCAHPPYPLWETLSDVVWMACWGAAAVFAIRSNLRLRLSFCAVLTLVPASRLLLRGQACLLELPAMVYVGAVAVRGLLRPGLPPEPGMCTVCGYSLTGNVSGRCPECGTAISAADATAASG